MRVTSSSQIDNYNIQLGERESSIRKNEVDGNVQPVLQYPKLNALEQIRKNSNQISNQNKYRKPSCELDEFDAENINQRFIRKKDSSYEPRDEQVTEKTKITAVTCIPDESRQVSYSQNNHSNIIHNEYSLNRNVQKNETQSENCQCQRKSIQSNLHFLNNTVQHNTTINTLNTFSPPQNQQILVQTNNSELAFEQDNNNNNNINTNNNHISNNNNTHMNHGIKKQISYQSIQGIDTFNEFEKKTNRGNKSNHTLTTLPTTQINSQNSVMPLTLLPSLASYTTKCRSKTTFSYKQHNSTQQMNIDKDKDSQQDLHNPDLNNLNSNNITYYQNNSFQNQNLNNQNNQNISLNNLQECNKSSLNLIQQDNNQQNSKNNNSPLNIPRKPSQQNISDNQELILSPVENSQHLSHLGLDYLQDSPLPINKLPTVLISRKQPFPSNTTLNTTTNTTKLISQDHQYQISQQSMKEMQLFLKEGQLQQINNNNKELPQQKQAQQQQLQNQLQQQQQQQQQQLQIKQNQEEKKDGQQLFKWQQQTLKKYQAINQKYEIRDDIHDQNQIEKDLGPDLTKIFKDISEIGIKTARSQINIESNIIYDDSLHSSNRVSDHLANLQNQIRLEIPKIDGQSQSPQLKKFNMNMGIENMDQVNILRGFGGFLPSRAKGQKTTFTTDLESKNKDYISSFCQHPFSIDEENKIQFNRIKINTINNQTQITKDNLNLKMNSLSEEEMKIECLNLLYQIELQEQNNVKNVTNILQKYIKYEKFMRILIIEAQRPIYNREISLNALFKFSSDSFLKDVVVSQIKKLESNQMLAFAEKQIEHSSFFRILQSFYSIFHSLFQKIILFYLISCIVIFIIFFTDQSGSLYIWGGIVLTFLFQIFISVLYNFKRWFQKNNWSQRSFFLVCYAQISLVCVHQYCDQRESQDQIYSIIFRIIQILISFFLSYCFHRIHRAARLFLLCFQILDQ